MVECKGTLMATDLVASGYEVALQARRYDFDPLASQIMNLYSGQSIHASNHYWTGPQDAYNIPLRSHICHIRHKSFLHKSSESLRLGHATRFGGSCRGNCELQPLGSPWIDRCHFCSPLISASHISLFHCPTGRRRERL